MPSKQSLLSAATILATAACATPALAFTSVASTLPSAAQHQGQSVAAASPLFRSKSTPVGQNRKVSPLERTSQLFMTSGGDSSEGEETTKQEEKTTNEKKEDEDESTALIKKPSSTGSDADGSGGFFLTLLLAPPLIAKFCLVLLLKFATDCVVYPTLFVWRLASRAKRKVLDTLGIGKGSNDTNDGAAPVNGNGSAPPNVNGDFA